MTKPEMPGEILPCPEFEKWFFTARDPVKDMPYGTHLIYRVCDNDPGRFEIGCELLQIAFVAGMNTRATSPPAPSADDDGLTIAYMLGVEHGKKATPSAGHAPIDWEAALKACPFEPKERDDIAAINGWYRAVNYLRERMEGKA